MSSCVGASAYDVLKADTDSIQKADRGGKTVAYADRSKVQAGEKLCFANGEEAEIESLI